MDSVPSSSDSFESLAGESKGQPTSSIKINSVEFQPQTSPKNEKKESCKRIGEEIIDNVVATTTDKIRCPQSKKIDLGCNAQEVIKKLFLVDMPEDFFSFWNMCVKLKSTDPANALTDIKLKLVGPFDVMAGKVKDVFEEDLPGFLRHWRFYYDPPECQTVLASTLPSCYHIGYYRDDPKELPVFVVNNSLNSKNPEKNGELKVMGPNLFAAFNAYLEELKADPFSRMKIPKYQKILKEWTNKEGFCLDKTNKQMEARARKVVAKTFHNAGIVVPVDKKNDVGYRELAASNVTIKKILKGIVESKSEEERTKYWEQLQPVMTFANIANDECDFGTCLELGLDLFSYGNELLHRSILQLLPTTYNLLQRPQFAAIIQAHLEDRRKGNKLSIL
ncbi:histone PARylation factor 1-like isoform X2 [Macrosteles quadrilineatus]|nr:histone PARylation factor 1-like isoform X2 [Macrosteles quadrilineatus]XP_054264877.1 histone PARylation factor 1-like isoform X2 [Macrosteles quadrilineatus]